MQTMALERCLQLSLRCLLEWQQIACGARRLLLPVERQPEGEQAWSQTSASGQLSRRTQRNVAKSGVA